MGLLFKSWENDKLGRNNKKIRKNIWVQIFKRLNGLTIASKSKKYQIFTPEHSRSIQEIDNSLKDYAQNMNIVKIKQAKGKIGNGANANANIFVNLKIDFDVDIIKSIIF